MYSSIGVYGRRPKYSRVNSQGAEEYAFYLEKQGRGLWIVAPSLGQENGWLTVRYLSENIRINIIPIQVYIYLDPIVFAWKRQGQFGRFLMETPGSMITW